MSFENLYLPIKNTVNFTIAIMRKVLFCFLFSLSFVLNGQSVSENIERALGAVVTVAVEKPLPSGKVLLGFRGNIVEEAYKKSLELTHAVSSGSGFIIERKGKKYIITNAHVVESASDAPQSLFVYTYNQKKHEVRVVGGDSFYDLAVLEFVQRPGDNLNALDFSPELPAIASRVYAIGNPLGSYPYTVTDGIVSAINRTRSGVTGKFGFIQTTATIIWGNSGGPLVNEQGQVVGINSQISFAPTPDGSSFQMQQINFALETPIAERLIDDILTFGKPRRAHLGIELACYYQMYKMGSGWAISHALSDMPVISNVFPGTDAGSKMHNYIGWGITAVNGVEVSNLEEVLGEFEKLKPHAQVQLNLVHKNERAVVSIKAAELSKNHLENLAIHVLGKMPDVQLDVNSAQVKIYESSTHGMMNRAGVFVAGGGSAVENDLWRITTLTDLGSLLRIYGLRGWVQYMLVSEVDIYREPTVYTQYFSDREDVLKMVLWY